MLKLITCVLVLSLASFTWATPVSQTFNGVITAQNFSVGAANQGLINIGDSVVINVIYEPHTPTSNTLISFSFSVDNGAFNVVYDNWNYWTTMVRTDNFAVVASNQTYPPAYQFTDNIQLTNTSFFSRQIANTGCQDPTNTWNFTATIIPEPATMCLLGLGGILFARKRK
jgi:hypothetical protein